jgi:hypothetical protein
MELTSAAELRRRTIDLFRTAHPPPTVASPPPHVAQRIAMNNLDTWLYVLRPIRSMRDQFVGTLRF